MSGPPSGEARKRRGGLLLSSTSVCAPPCSPGLLAGTQTLALRPRHSPSAGRREAPRRPNPPFFLILRTYPGYLAQFVHRFNRANWENSTESAQTTQFVIDSSNPSFYYST